MKRFAMALAALAFAMTANAAPGGPGGHGGGGFGGGHGGGFGGGHGGGFGGGHGGFGGGGYHGGGGFHGGGGYHGGYHGGHIGGGYHGGHGHWGSGGVWIIDDGGYYGGCGYYGCEPVYSAGVACAPEVVEGNVSVTERTLNTLAATPAFASAKTFKAELAQVSMSQDSSEKAQAYLALAGIDSKNTSAIADFVGSRDAKGAWITDLQRNADLTSVQAEARRDQPPNGTPR